MDATTAAWRRLRNGTLLVRFTRQRPYVRVYTTLGGGGRKVTPKPLACSLNARGYPRIEVGYRGRKHTVLLHRLVWMDRNGRCIKAGAEIDHDDGDKRNYRPGNLVLVSPPVNLALRNERNGWNGKTINDLSEAELDAYYEESTRAFLAS